MNMNHDLHDFHLLLIAFSVAYLDTGSSKTVRKSTVFRHGRVEFLLDVLHLTIPYRSLYLETDRQHQHMEDFDHTTLLVCSCPCSSFSQSPTHSWHRNTLAPTWQSVRRICCDAIQPTGRRPG